MLFAFKMLHHCIKPVQVFPATRGRYRPLNCSFRQSICKWLVDGPKTAFSVTSPMSNRQFNTGCKCPTIAKKTTAS